MKVRRRRGKNGLFFCFYWLRCFPSSVDERSHLFIRACNKVMQLSVLCAHSNRPHRLRGGVCYGKREYYCLSILPIPTFSWNRSTTSPPPPPPPPVLPPSLSVCQSVSLSLSLCSFRSEWNFACCQECLPQQYLPCLSIQLYAPPPPVCNFTARVHCDRLDVQYQDSISRPPIYL